MNSKSVPIGFPHRVLAAPMIGVSDLAFRLLCRRMGCDVVYTEMFPARKYATDSIFREKFHETHEDDHPLVVQFAGRDPEDFVPAAILAVQRGADAIDINLGCPQQDALDNSYGAYMPHDAAIETVRLLRSTRELHNTPIFVKIRLQHKLEETLQFAKALEEAGASLLVVHGRTRGSPTKRRVGAACLDSIKAIVFHLSIPVISNGNVRHWKDILHNMQYTKAAGVMIGEALLKFPAIAWPIQLDKVYWDGILDSNMDRITTATDNGVLQSELENGDAGNLIIPLGRKVAGQDPLGAHDTTVSTSWEGNLPPPQAVHRVMQEYFSLARLHPPPGGMKTIASHVSWMFGREGSRPPRYRFHFGLPHSLIKSGIFNPNHNLDSIQKLVDSLFLWDRDALTGQTADSSRGDEFKKRGIDFFNSLIPA